MHHSQFNPSLSFNDDKLMMGRCQEMVNYFPSLKWVGMYSEEDPLIHLFNEKHKRDDCISAYRVAAAPSCVNTYPCAGGVLTKFNERDNHPCVTMECILVNYCMYLYYFTPITQMVWRVVILFMGPLVGSDPVWPQDHFGPILTSAPIIPHPDAYFGQRTKFSKVSFCAFYRFRGCLRVKLKP